MDHWSEVEESLRRKEDKQRRHKNEHFTVADAQTKIAKCTKVRSLDELISQKNWRYYVSGEDTVTDNKSLFLELIKISEKYVSPGTYGMKLSGFEYLPMNVDYDIFNKLIKETRRSGIVYRGVRFSSELDLYDFLKELKEDKESHYLPQSLTVFLGVAKAFAGLRSDGAGFSYKLVLALDPNKLELRKVNYCNFYDKDYEPVENIPAGELRTDKIPAAAVRGIMVYDCNSNYSNSIKRKIYTSIPNPLEVICDLFGYNTKDALSRIKYLTDARDKKRKVLSY